MLNIIFQRSEKDIEKWIFANYMGVYLATFSGWL